MLNILVAVRDFLIAAALAWVGVTLEARDARTSAPACSGDSCQHDAR